MVVAWNEMRSGCANFLYPSCYAIVLMDLIVDLMNFFHQEDKNPPFDKFADIWNAFINSLREEDLLSNRFPLLLIFLDFLYWTWHTLKWWISFIYREKNLLVVPSSGGETSVFQWPPFLLASKVHTLCTTVLLYNPVGFCSAHYQDILYLDSNCTWHGKECQEKRWRTHEEDKAGSLYWVCCNRVLRDIIRYPLQHYSWTKW